MWIPEPIDRILELSEAIQRHHFWGRNRKEETAGGKMAPPPEVAQLRAHLTSLSPAALYFAIVALEIGRGVLNAESFMPAYLAAAGAFHRHDSAVERLMKDPVHLANCLESGLIRLHEAGIDVNGLFQSSVGRKPRVRPEDN
jgi:hypothetical protein